ncbi:putative nuclease HARBI1 [Zophobas morio]
MELARVFESSSSSSDEELGDLLVVVDRVKVFRDRRNPFEIYSEAEFRDRYRFYKDTVRHIITLIEDNIAPMTLRNCSLSPADQLLIALRFYATGAFQILVGDDYGVHKSTVCRVVQRVSEHLAGMCPHFVKMPENQQEKLLVKTGFHAIRGFPNVIGCVDGSHVPITSPGGENAELFRNRKTYFSINVQAVCDSKLNIRDIVARWPGSTHDSTIWNASLLSARCENREFQGSYILGDSAYGCTPYLMTPLLNPTTPAERNYNAAHKATRNCIERCFGNWKRRFACLSLGLRTKLENTLTILVATAVLHNIAISQNDQADDFEAIQQYEDVENDINNDNFPGGNAARRALIDTVFRHLH